MEVIQLRKIMWLLCCVPILLLAACDENQNVVESKKAEPDVSIETVNLNDENTVHIVPLFSAYERYLKASLETSDAGENQQYFKKHVLDTIGAIGEETGVDTSFIKTYFPLQPTPHKQQLLGQVDALIERYDEIEEIITTTYTDSNQILPKKKSTVFIAPYNPEFYYDSVPMKGVAGMMDQDIIILFIDADFDKDVLAYTVAHEYHHLILRDQNKYQINSNLEAIFVEGKADAFADRIVKGVSPPWNVETDESTMENIASHVNDEETSIDDFMSGNHEKDIPRWSKYILGRDILTQYLEANPHLSIAEWTFQEDEVILEGYIYQDIIEKTE